MSQPFKAVTQTLGFDKIISGAQRAITPPGHPGDPGPIANPTGIQPVSTPQGTKKGQPSTFLAGARAAGGADFGSSSGGKTLLGQ